MKLDVKPGRNDPCSCGSGKKFKKCCRCNNHHLTTLLSTGSTDKSPSKQSYQSTDRINPADAALVLKLIHGKRYVELENKARELIMHHPHSEFAWDVLVTAIKMQGKSPLHALQQAVEHLPNSAKMHGNLGNAFQEHAKLDEALKSYQRALTLNPAMVEIHCNLGNILRDMGQLHDAVSSYQCALTINPHFADGYNNLGNALRDLGKLESAVESYRKALLIKPDFALAYCNLGINLHDLGQFEEAIDNYRHALKYAPQFSGAFNNMGSSLLAMGLFDEAIASYQRALELTPDFVGAHNNLGNAFQEIGRFDLAENSYQRALALNPRFFEAHNNLGNAWRECGRLNDAAMCFQNALAINPHYADAYHNLSITLRQQNHIAEAMINCRQALSINPRQVKAIIFLAELHTDKGEFSEAETLYKHAISISPSSPEAWAGIVRIRKMTNADKPWLDTVKKIVAQNLPPRKEVYLRYAIGKFYNDVEDFEQAFDNYRRANALSKSFAERYDPLHHTSRINSLMKTYNRNWLNKHGIASNLSTRPVLVIGMPRSGTSLVEQILASHPDVFGAGELTFWDAGFMAIEQSIQCGENTADVLHKLANDYLQVLESLSSEALRVVDKMPANFMFLGLIHAAFPHARIIHMQRNPIDTSLSIYFQHFENSLHYANDLENIVHYYQEYLRLMEHWRTVLPDNTILNVPYEELVRDQEHWSRKILDFIGLPWNQHCISFEKNVRIVSTTSNWQVRQKIYHSSVQRWRNYEKFVGPLLAMLEPVLE